MLDTAVDWDLQKLFRNRPLTPADLAELQRLRTY